MLRADWRTRRSLRNPRVRCLVFALFMPYLCLIYAWGVIVKIKAEAPTNQPRRLLFLGRRDRRPFAASQPDRLHRFAAGSLPSTVLNSRCSYHTVG